MRSVVDHGEVVPLGNLRDAQMVGRQAEQVHRDHGAGPEPPFSLDALDPLLQVVGIDVEGPAIHFDEDRFRPQQQYDLCGRRKGERG